MTCSPMVLSAGPVFLSLLLTPCLPAAQEAEIAATVAFTEGPTVDRDGNVYFSDLLN